MQMLRYVFHTHTVEYNHSETHYVGQEDKQWGISSITLCDRRMYTNCQLECLPHFGGGLMFQVHIYSVFVALIYKVGRVKIGYLDGSE